MSREPATSPAISPPDQAARERATREFATNLVVTAGAGTGKTAILVERTLNLIGRGEATLGRLALITFTDKAAAELRLRLGSGLDRLRRRAAGDGSPIDVRQDGDRAWSWLAASGVGATEIGGRALAALQELDAASVGTIHQFCLDLLRRHPREARVDPRAAAGEAAAIDRVVDEAWDRFLRGGDGPGGRGDAWRAAISRSGSTAAVRALGEALARFTLPAAAREPYQAPPLQELLAPTLDPIRSRLDDLAGRARKMPEKMTAFLALARAQLAEIARDGLTRAAARRLAADLGPFLKSFPTAGKRLEGVSAAEVEEAATEALDLLRALAAIDEEAVAALHETARPLAGAAQRLTLERGFIPFDAMLRLARETLARHPVVRRETRARFRMLLVDEFQDTDPLQYEVVFLIAGRDSGAGAAAEIDAWNLDLEPGRLFIVGDPKQSIYRFRRADIAAFRRAVGRVRACGGEELRLSASFRSPSRLLTPINRLFDDWLGPRGDWRDDERPPYVPIEPAAGAEAAGPPRVQIWSADAGPGADALAGRRAEAAAIAAAIAARLGTPTDDGQAWRPSQFALLFRATGNVGVYARALATAGIPSLVEGGRDFAERPEVGDLLSFLRAVANPNDGPALLAVL
ncbi:MAG TPA: UvrD-helicase domain-containing protein, partial [Dongiaceae bacterium]|nr:UvrD-helicase domain-containing protein [Dongiaceae bacterium]